jgi:hypothetical protein
LVAWLEAATKHAKNVREQSLTHELTEFSFVNETSFNELKDQAQGPEQFGGLE